MVVVGAIITYFPPKRLQRRIFVRLALIRAHCWSCCSSSQNTNGMRGLSFHGFHFPVFFPLNFGDLLPLGFTLFRSLTAVYHLLSSIRAHVFDDVLLSHFVIRDVVGLFFNQCHLASILNFPFLIITVYKYNKIIIIIQIRGI